MKKLYHSPNISSRVANISIDKPIVTHDMVVKSMFSGVKSPLILTKMVNDCMEGSPKKLREYKYHKTQLNCLGMVGRTKPIRSRGVMANEQAKIGGRYTFEKNGVKQYSRVDLAGLTPKQAIQAIMKSDCSNFIKSELALPYIKQLTRG